MPSRSHVIRPTLVKLEGASTSDSGNMHKKLTRTQIKEPILWLILTLAAIVRHDSKGRRSLAEAEMSRRGWLFTSGKEISYV